MICQVTLDDCKNNCTGKCHFLTGQASPPPPTLAELVSMREDGSLVIDPSVTSFGAMTIADAEYVPSEEMITAYLRAQHQYCHEADQRGEVEYSRKACVAGLKAALRSRN